MPATSPRPLVALAEPPGVGFVAALEEAWSAGAAVLPLDPRAPAGERDRIRSAMRPDLGVDDDVALVITTSGSTGAPKGAELTRAALQASARATMQRIGVADDDVWLSCLPWHHIGGLQVLLRARQFATPLVIHEVFDVDRVAAERSATLVSLVPTQLLRLLDANVDLARFRVILLGGAAAPAALLDRATAAGANVVTTYGMSETCGGCVYDGRPLDDVAVQLAADGRVMLRGPMVMQGYRLDPALTARTLVDGWLVTNDVGDLDGEGRLVLHGRIDDVVITGGENVVTTHVAARLMAHPKVKEAEVIGVPDAEWGQRVVAVVVASSPPPTLADLRAWCHATLPPAAAPRQLVLVDELPRLSSGKVDRLRLADLLSGVLPSSQ